MKKKPIYVFGEVLFDCFPNSEPVLGGAPFNVAWHLQGFGESPQLISAVGNDDMGRQIIRAMDKWGMSTAGLQRQADKPTGKVNIELNHGEPRYEIREHAAYDYLQLSAEQLQMLQAGSFFYHGSLAARHSVSAETLQQIHQSKPFNYFIDVNLRSPWWSQEAVLKSVNYAFCVKLNLDELKALTGHTENFLWAEDKPDTDWVQLAREFKLTHNIVNLLVTRGEHGASLINASGEVISVCNANPSPVTDTVGAGDAFASVLLLGFINGWDLLVSMERAQDFANFIIMQRGAICTDISTYRDFRMLWNIVNPIEYEL